MSAPSPGPTRTGPAALTTAPLDPRQVMGFSSSTPTTSAATVCESFLLPSGGTLFVAPGTTLTLSAQAVYRPGCGDDFAVLQNASVLVAGSGEAFYASTTPLIYVIAGCTFVAWFLFIILFLLPGGYIGVTRRRPARPWRPSANFFSALTERPVAGSARPWLQKIAAFLVVLSLTTVTADAFRYIKYQYDLGYTNASDLRDNVTYKLEVKILRVISDLFLWLAQIQTLIRLFPRHKEKLIIKWIGFLLILLDTIFDCLNSFLKDPEGNRPREYEDAISALSYLFQLAMNLLYAAWVLYYALTKRKYAFYHPLMPTVAVIAFFSIISILIPVVFFLVDLLKSPVGTWGDYFRWLGSAASSIVVWEWVQRIEALERDEKKDGILGREVFDEDEMDHHTVSDASSRTSIDRGLGYSSDTVDTTRSPPSRVARLKAVTGRFGLVRLPRKRRRAATSDSGDEKEMERAAEGATAEPRQQREQVVTYTTPAVQAPAPVASPVDRTQNISTGSTVYSVRYHPVAETPPTVPGATARPGTNARSNSPLMGVQEEGARTAPEDLEANAASRSTGQSARPLWGLAANAFKRSRKSPPIEVKKVLSSLGGQEKRESWQKSPRLLGRFSGHGGRQEEEAPSAPAEPTVIPAPPRGQMWSPDTKTHSPVQNRETPDATASNGPRQSGAPGPLGTARVASTTTTPKPAALDGAQSASYDFGSTPPPPNRVARGASGSTAEMTTASSSSSSSSKPDTGSGG